MSHIFPNETRIHEILESSRENLRDYALLQLATSTALRGIDLLRLRRREIIDSDGDIVRVLRIKQKKTGKYVERSLREDCRNAIREWMNAREDKNPFLFCSLSLRHAVKNERQLNRCSYHRIMKRYLSRYYHASVLQGCSTHTLRRAVAKLVYKKTGEIAAAQALLGHSSPVNTIRYLDPSEFKEKADRAVLNLEI